MKQTEPLNLSIVADVALDGALERELVHFVLLLPTCSAQTRRVSDGFRLSRLGSKIHDELLQVLGLAWSGMHIPNYPSCFGCSGCGFIWWGLIGAALLCIIEMIIGSMWHTEIDNLKRRERLRFSRWMACTRMARHGGRLWLADALRRISVCVRYCPLTKLLKNRLAESSRV